MLSPLERLSRIRKTLGFSQRELAKEFGVSVGAVGLWETREREIPKPVVKLIDLYESELFPQARAACVIERSTNAVVKSFAFNVRLTDAQIIKKLQSALAEYVQSWETNPVGERLRLLALHRLVETIKDSRGIAMKVAQMMSLTDPRIPAEMHSLFESIQLQGTAMNRQMLEKIFVDEFGCAIADLYSEFSLKPIASASIGQVHNARLRDGTPVAVKVQHPDIRDKIAESFGDTEFIQQLLLLLGGQPGCLQTLIDNMHETAVAECDFELEAAHQETLRELFANDKEIKIPRVISSHSCKRVLTMEWMEGRSWTDFKRDASQDERDFAARTISRFYAQCAFVHGIFQADPHPGNYLLPSGAVAFLDFGRVKKLNDQQKHEMHRFHMLLMNGDREATSEFVKSTSLFKLGANFDFSRFWEIVSELTQHLRQDQQLPFNQAVLVRHRLLLKELGEGGKMQITPEFFWPLIFTHTLMISGRVDLGASANWRRILTTGSEPAQVRG